MKIFYRIYIKPLFDFMASLTALIIVAPIFVIIVLILCYTNNGEPFFYQSRIGKNGKIFTIIKLKTMTDKRDNENNLLPAIERVTKIGNICRKYSLDELPQLINVLKGDMSLIGPRPLLSGYLSLYSTRQRRRHEVLPGITGWAQVNGRNTISWEQKFEYDIYYVEHQSLGLDLNIILKTIAKVIKTSDINNSESIDMPEFTGTKQQE